MHACADANQAKQKNRGVNEIWAESVLIAASNASSGVAPKPLCAHLVRMGDLGNVPRQEKKFKVPKDYSSSSRSNENFSGGTINVLHSPQYSACAYASLIIVTRASLYACVRPRMLACGCVVLLFVFLYLVSTARTGSPLEYTSVFCVCVLARVRALFIL